MSNSTRNTILSVAAIVGLSLLALNFSGAATTTTTAPARHYYLTKATVNGNGALKACKSGYHFASFAEISDLAVLSYNTSLGRSAPDDGEGPPVPAVGWVRTGYSSNSAPGGGLPTNCNLWTSGASADDGEVAIINPDFGGNQTVEPVIGFADSVACDNSDGYDVGVWCMEN